MARSFKKNPIIKDSGLHKNYMQKLSHSRMRSEIKRRLLKGQWDTMPLSKELTNSWDVCDWKSYININEMYKYWKPTLLKYKNKKYLRK